MQLSGVSGPSRAPSKLESSVTVAAMHLCGGKHGAAVCAAADPFMGSECASHIGDENM